MALGGEKKYELKNNGGEYNKGGEVFSYTAVNKTEQCCQQSFLLKNTHKLSERGGGRERDIMDHNLSGFYLGFEIWGRFCQKLSV